MLKNDCIALSANPGTPPEFTLPKMLELSSPCLQATSNAYTFKAQTRSPDPSALVNRYAVRPEP